MASNRTIYRNCTDCGEEFVINPKFQDYIKENDLKLPKRCKKCRENRKMNSETVMCECGDEFTITPNEAKFYAERGLDKPKRCPACREKRRNNGKAKE